MNRHFGLDGEMEWPKQSKNVCFLSSLFGGGSQTTKSAPWSAQAPYLKQIFGQAQDLYQGTAPQYYPGSTVSPFNSTESGALNNISSLGANDPTTAAATGFNSDLLNGQYLNSNPYQDDTAKSVLSQVIPSITSQFVKDGSMGNPQAAYAAAQGATSALAPIEYQNYQNDIGNMIKGEALAPQTQGMQYTDYTNQFGAGQQQQNQSQSQLTDQVNRFNYNQNLPEQQLQKYLQTVSGNYGGTQTTSQSSNPLSSIFGFLSQPASQFGSTLGNIGSNLGTIGSAASGAASGGLDALSSLLAFL